MKKIMMMLVASVLAVGTLAPVAAQAIEASADAYVSVASVYVWRGFNLSEDDAFVVQPGADVSIGNFTVSWWGNMSENDGNMNEVDLTLDYSFDLGELFSVSVGNILYDVDGLADTNEVYLGVTLNTLLSPALTVYYDYDEFETVYTTLGISHGFDLSDALALSLGATVGYYSDDTKGFGTTEDWFHNFDMTAGLDYAVSDQITVGVSALYTLAMSDDAKNIAGIEDHETSAALTATFAF